MCSTADGQYCKKMKLLENNNLSDKVKQKRDGELNLTPLDFYD